MDQAWSIRYAQLELKLPRDIAIIGPRYTMWCGPSVSNTSLELCQDDPKLN